MQAAMLDPFEVPANKDAASRLLAAVMDQYDEVRNALPKSLSDTLVIDTIFKKAKIVAATQVWQRSNLVNHAFLGGGDQVALELDKFEREFIAQLPQPPKLNTDDFRPFIYELSEKVLRHTYGEIKDTGQTDDSNFWDRMFQYVSSFSDGNFVDYFGTKYGKPTVALTVTDVELANIVSLFLEFLLDEALKTPVWVAATDNSHYGDTTSTKLITNLDGNVLKAGWEKGMAISDDANDIPADTTIADIGVVSGYPGVTVTISKPATKSTVHARFTVTASSKTYYPGNSANEPTELTVQRRSAVPISLDPNDSSCGMTIKKAKLINALAEAFSGAASNATGAAVGTIGGVGVSFGFFGKVSIGDNKAVTSTIDAAVSELVRRLTVEATYRDLVLHSFPRGTLQYNMTEPFSSPNLTTPQPFAWLP
jgi:hypothetical protein